MRLRLGLGKRLGQGQRQGLRLRLGERLGQGLRLALWNELGLSRGAEGVECGYVREVAQTSSTRDALPCL